ncbi:MAG: UPF0175 family protein [Methanocellales archaeon]|nr:UPF0175 family protein [Methanocellales archaeon]MDI6902477.1 UPF0175 family protein [Methanocellales archaeon]
MGQLISVRLSEDIHAELERLSQTEDKDKSVIIRELLTRGIKERKLDDAIERYRQGKITLWKASRIANISLWKIIEVLKERHVELQYGPEELRDDLKALEESP